VPPRPANAAAREEGLEAEADADPVAVSAASVAAASAAAAAALGVDATTLVATDNNDDTMACEELPKEAAAAEQLGVNGAHDVIKVEQLEVKAYEWSHVIKVEQLDVNDAHDVMKAEQLEVNDAHNVRAGDAAAARAEPVGNRGGGEKRKAAAPAAASDVDGANGGAPPKKKRGCAVAHLHEEEEEFSIDAILQHRDGTKGKRQYLIKWAGYGPEHNSWEPESEIRRTDFYADYWSRHGPPPYLAHTAQQS
jgi:hypothetical protein